MTETEHPEAEPAPPQEEPELMDAPNQQAVRPDASGPGDEGDGGSTREETPPATEPDPEPEEEPAEEEAG